MFGTHMWGTTMWGSPGLVAFAMAASCRLAVITFENRFDPVEFENRFFNIEAEYRFMDVPPIGRTTKITVESRRSRPRCFSNEEV